MLGITKRTRLIETNPPFWAKLSDRHATQVDRNASKILRDARRLWGPNQR